MTGAVPNLPQAVSEMSPDEKSNFRIPPGTLSPVHFRAIQRIYGARSAHHPGLLPAQLVSPESAEDACQIHRASFSIRMLVCGGRTTCSDCTDRKPLQPRHARGLGAVGDTALPCAPRPTH